MTRIVAKLNKVLTSTSIHNEATDTCKKVKNEFGNSSGLWQRNLFIERITETIIIFKQPF